MKYLFINAAILFMFTSCAYSQRCGDGILFSFADKSNTAIDVYQLKVEGAYYDSYYWDKDAKVKPGMKLKYPEYYQVQKDTIYISKINRHVELKDSTHFYIRTFCSMLLMRVKVGYNGSVMRLDIYNIPGDIPFRIDNIPFAAGNYEINLNGYIDENVYPKNSEGIHVIGFDKFKSGD